MSRTLDRINRIIARLAIKAIIRGVETDPAIQRVAIQGLAGEDNISVEHLQPYGFSSHPIPAGEGDRKGPIGIVLSLAGAPNHRVAVVIDDERYRPKDWEPGESGLYDDQGQKVHLQRGGILELLALSKVVINAPTSEVNSQEATINATTKAVVNSPAVELGGEGGKKVARVGDKVDVGSGSSAGLWPIVEGSNTVKAVD